MWIQSFITKNIRIYKSNKFTLLCYLFLIVNSKHNNKNKHEGSTDMGRYLLLSVVFIIFFKKVVFNIPKEFGIFNSFNLDRFFMIKNNNHGMLPRGEVLGHQ